MSRTSVSRQRQSTRLLAAVAVIILWIQSLFALQFTDAKPDPNQEAKLVNERYMVVLNITLGPDEYHHSVDVKVTNKSTGGIITFPTKYDIRHFYLTHDTVGIRSTEVTVTPLDMMYQPTGPSQTRTVHDIYVFKVTVLGGTFDPFVIELPELKTDKFDQAVEAANTAMGATTAAAKQIKNTIGDLENPAQAMRGLKAQVQDLRQAVNGVKPSDWDLTPGNIEKKKEGGPFGFVLEMPEDSGFTMRVARSDTITATDDKYGNKLGPLSLAGTTINDGQNRTFINETQIKGPFSPSGNYGTIRLAGELIYRNRTTTHTAMVSVQGVTEEALKTEVGELHDQIWLDLEGKIDNVEDLTLDVGVLAGIVDLIAGICAALQFWLAAIIAGVIGLLLTSLTAVLAILSYRLGRRRDFLLNQLDRFPEVEGKKLPD